MAHSTRTETGHIDTFHLFPQLPSELRSQIWRLAASEPRHIRLQTNRDNPLIQYLIPSLPPPAILHTCQESRTEAQAYYTKAFSVANAPQFIWTNFNVDTIEVENIYQAYNLGETDIVQIQRLAIPMVDSEYCVRNMLYAIEGMIRLEEVVILTHRVIFDWDPKNLDKFPVELEKWHADFPSLKIPRIVLREAETGLEMDLQNHMAVWCGQVIGTFERIELGVLGYLLVRDDWFT